MIRFRYKPALLRGARVFDLSDRELRCSGADGTPIWQLDWTDITGAAFVEQTVGRSRIRRFELFHGKDQTQAISYNGRRGPVEADPDSVAHLQLIRAILDRLAVQDPDMAVKVGDFGRSRLYMFLAGLLSLVMGLGLGITMIATGVDMDKALAALTPVLLLLATGAMICFSYWPWRPVPTVRVGALSTNLTPISEIGPGSSD